MIKKSPPKKAAKKVAPKKKSSPKKESFIGKEVEFLYTRLPNQTVTGLFLEDDGEWIRLKLTKELQGLVNIWHEGEERSFRKLLIKGELKLKK